MGLRYLTVVFVILLLSACGGGGSSTAPEGESDDGQRQTESQKNWDAMRWDQDNWS